MRAVVSKDQYFIDMLPAIAARSKDASNQVGAIAVGPDGEIRSTGLNGFPTNVDETSERWDKESGEKYKWVVHAEANLIYNAARVGIPLKGCTMYVSFLPCIECAKGIVQAGFDNVVIDYDNHQRVQTERWEVDRKRVQDMLWEGGVELSLFTRETEQ